MSQPTDQKKIRMLEAYHTKLIMQHRNGTLNGKVKCLLEARARKIGVTVRTYYRRKKVL